MQHARGEQTRTQQTQRNADGGKRPHARATRAHAEYNVNVALHAGMHVRFA